MDWPLRFGIFLAPFHPVGQNPTLALERDLELVVRLDEMGYDEAWFGEHHSAGYEIIASPEVFIGVLSQRTRNIRLGTGVSSLPYHHPFILADRMVLLDHLTRGRVMFGVGPGALPSDAFMLGIDPMNQRDMMEESLEAILALLDGTEPVTRDASWFTLRNARLQLRPYTHPRFEVAVAAQISPAGPRAAGRFGLSLLSIGATSAGGFDVLGSHWQVMEERAVEFGTEVDRRKWRLVGPMHIAESEEQARAEVKFGLAQWVDYFERVAALPLAPGTLDPDKMVDALMETGFAVVGTPAMAIAQIQRLVEQSGGFGTYLLMAHEWADREATLRSYELFAREVVPHFKGTLSSLEGSRDWAAENRPEFIGAVGGAIMQAITDHHAERDAKHVEAKTTES
jgi:limonene 1,2-monooxygenase